MIILLIIKLAIFISPLLIFDNLIAKIVGMVFTFAIVFISLINLYELNNYYPHIDYFQGYNSLSNKIKLNRSQDAFLKCEYLCN